MTDYDVDKVLSSGEVEPESGIEFIITVNGLMTMRDLYNDLIDRQVSAKTDALFSVVPQALEEYFAEYFASKEQFKQRYLVALAGEEDTPEQPTRIFSFPISFGSDEFEGSHEELVTALDALAEAWQEDIIVRHSGSGEDKQDLDLFPNTPANRSKLAAYDAKIALLAEEELQDEA